MKADVIYPPVDTDFFKPSGGQAGDYYLMVTAFAPYKRIDLAIEAFAKSGRKLIIAGDGPEAAKLKASAPSNVEFTGWIGNEEVRKLMQGCRAFLLPGLEDFGIALLEAQACGRPVVAYSKGGAGETVIDFRKNPAGATGVLFDSQDAVSLNAAIELMEKNRGNFEPAFARKQAEKFGRRVFTDKFRKAVSAAASKGEIAC